jgi:hypothetical protein
VALLNIVDVMVSSGRAAGAGGATADYTEGGSAASSCHLRDGSLVRLILGHAKGRMLNLMYSLTCSAQKESKRMLQTLILLDKVPPVLLCADDHARQLTPNDLVLTARADLPDATDPPVHAGAERPAGEQGPARRLPRCPSGEPQWHA